MARKKVVQKEEVQIPMQVPDMYSLWIAVVIAIVFLLLIIAGQTAPGPAQVPATLQLPSQQVSALHGKVQFNTSLPDMSQPAPLKK